MAKVFWKGVKIAESSEVEIVEGNKYFPPSAVKKEVLRENSFHTVCHWKGKASYYDLILEDNTTVENIAWFYPEPGEKAEYIRNYVAFDLGKGVTFED